MNKMSKTTPTSGKLLSEPVVFFGSGPVAARSLELLTEWAQIEAVITKPKPPHHKEAFPVLETAERHQLPVLEVRNRQELDELMLQRPVKSRLGVLVDFGIIVSQDVIDYFELGIVNSHFSILPEWRGADPITSAILSGQEQTGVSLMLLVAKMDEGPLLAQGIHDIGREETTVGLTEALIELSDGLLETCLQDYVEGIIVPRPQEVVAKMMLYRAPQTSYSRKLTKEDGLLDWHMPATQLERQVRAYLSWPKSHTSLANHDVVITKAHTMPGKGTPGTIWRSGKELGIYTIDDIFVIDMVKPAGKGEMPIASFLAGYGAQL